MDGLIMDDFVRIGGRSRHRLLLPAPRSITRSGAGAVALITCVFGLLAPGAAVADSIQVLLERSGEKEQEVVVLRQVWDMARGFDSYFIETFSLPSGKKTSSRALASGDRNLLSAVGQYEIYMQAVKAEQEKETSRLERTGYAPVCAVVGTDTPGVQNATLTRGDPPVILRVKQDDGTQRLVIERGEKTFTLLKFKPLPGSGRDLSRSVRRDLMAVAVVGRGEHLAVVVRRQVFPSSEAVPDDDLYFIPLKKGLAALDAAFPLQEPMCKRMAP